MQDNKNRMYAIVIGQCSLSLQSTIKGDDEYISKYKVFNVIYYSEEDNSGGRHKFKPCTHSTLIYYGLIYHETRADGGM